MKLHEYQAQNILRQYGVPVPGGDVATSVDEVRHIATALGGRVVLKAQVLTGGRGRAGGIRLADDVAQAERLADVIFGMRIQGYPVSKILVNEALEIEREVYLGMMLDRQLAQPVIVAAAEGNVEISRVEHETPERVWHIPVDPLLGLRVYQVRDLTNGIGLDRTQWDTFVRVAMGLYRAFAENEAVLLEVNPLVICPNGRMVSLDARMIVDDNALFRRRDLAELRDETQETEREQLARRYSIHYVSLNGEVACLANGAGLAMVTMDLLRARGIRPSCFIDLGGGARAERVQAALQLAMADQPRVILINVFGGVTRCDVIAEGLLAVCGELDVPLVLRFDGWNAQQAYDLLAGHCSAKGAIHTAHSSEEAVGRAAALVKETKQ
ncbi:MAG: ADP-forming succinate--CoA ligase subunit beta [Anaerolineae bacterium]|nr:ADP-forming succinate--CoA ligase subunit beta [Anaerolineae bacterium]